MKDQQWRACLRILRRCSRVSPGASGSCSHSSCFVRGFFAAALRLVLLPVVPLHVCSVQGGFMPLSLQFH